MYGRGAVGGLVEADEHDDQLQHALSSSDGKLNLAHKEFLGELYRMIK